MRQALAMKEMEKEAAAKKRGRYFLRLSVLRVSFFGGPRSRRVVPCLRVSPVAFPLFRSSHSPFSTSLLLFLSCAHAHPSWLQKNLKTPAQKPPFAPKSKPTKRPGPRKPQGTRRSARVSPSRPCPIALRRLYVDRRRRRASRAQSTKRRGFKCG